MFLAYFIAVAEILNFQFINKLSIMHPTIIISIIVPFISPKVPF